MAQTEKILLWLEDVPKTVENQLDFTEEKITVKRVSQLHDFEEILKNPEYEVKAIVLDIMLHGVHDLEGLGIQNIDTARGYEAGLHVLKEYLRAPDSKFKNIPVLILSVLDLEKQQAESKEMQAKLRKPKKWIDFLKSQENVASLQLIEKRKEGWDKQFKVWLTKILGRN